MKYNQKLYPKKVKARIQRHKRVRYHNDAVLFPDDSSSATRKRRISVIKANVMSAAIKHTKRNNVAEAKTLDVELIQAMVG